MESRPALRETLNIQLQELEMLQSMFPGETEIVVEDYECLMKIKDFIEGRLDDIENRLGYIINLSTPLGSFEVVCHFSHKYPNEPPEIFTRPPKSFGKESYCEFSDDLNSYVKSLELGDLYMVSIIQWINENISSYQLFLTGKCVNPTPTTSTSDLVKLDNSNQDRQNGLNFVRLWIYSHHIFSKLKRRDIINIALEINLSGFSVPGKPGLICVEGFEKDVNEFWSRIRHMSWKKLSIKEREVYSLVKFSECDKMRKFDKFEEKDFDVRGGKGREYHMDLGKVFEYMDSVGCGHIFTLYFGVDGRLPNKDK